MEMKNMTGVMLCQNRRVYILFFAGRGGWGDTLKNLV